MKEMMHGVNEGMGGGKVIEREGWRLRGVAYSDWVGVELQRTEAGSNLVGYFYTTQANSFFSPSPFLLSSFAR